MLQHTRITDEAGDNEFDCYLADSCIPTGSAALMNWKVYPNLAKLAVSVHLIPGVYLYWFSDHFLTILLYLHLSMLNKHSPVVVYSSLISAIGSALKLFALSCALEIGHTRTWSQMRSYWVSFFQTVMMTRVFLVGLRMTNCGGFGILLCSTVFLIKKLLANPVWKNRTRPYPVWPGPSGAGTGLSQVSMLGTWPDPSHTPMSSIASALPASLRGYLLSLI